MEEKNIIAGNLVLYRKKANISQLELAKKLNYSNKNISKWENGETIPNVFILKKIADLYGITVDDLLSEITIDKQEEVDKKVSVATRKKNYFRITLLALANAILFAVACITVYVLGLANIDIEIFNKWYVFLYITPLCILSVLIYIRVLYKHVSIFLISLFGWLICLSLYLSLIHIQNISLIFIVGLAYQLIVLFIAVLVNIKISTKMQKFFAKIKIKRKTK